MITCILLAFLDPSLTEPEAYDKLTALEFLTNVTQEERVRER